jgi:MFS family permease
MTGAPHRRWTRLPFYAGWMIVGIAFVTMAISVTTRTAFSLLLPPLLDEFGWQRGLAAGAFSFGFLVSAALAPIVGRVVDRYGPRRVIETGVVLMAAGLFLATATSQAWQLYATLGMLVGVGVNLMSFTVQSLYLPHWFVRRRALAIGIAFSGVGVGAVALLPWLQTIIAGQGWRTACVVLGLLVLLVAGPLNLLVRHRPQDIGLRPDGAVDTPDGGEPARDERVVDAEWAATEWTLARALRTGRFWWIALGYFCGLFAWYAVQVHQTKYLIEIGFAPTLAAWALGLVGFAGIAGQIGLGHLSDRIGREWVWTLACAGYVVCYAVLLLMRTQPTAAWLYVMVGAQGLLGYGLASVYGAIPAEIFQGKHYGKVFGTLSLASSTGAALGPWVAGALYDRTGSYVPAFSLGIAASIISAVAIWLAAPRRVRAVAGKVPRPA